MSIVTPVKGMLFACKCVQNYVVSTRACTKTSMLWLIYLIVCNVGNHLVLDWLDISPSHGHNIMIINYYYDSVILS